MFEKELPTLKEIIQNEEIIIEILSKGEIKDVRPIEEVKKVPPHKNEVNVVNFFLPHRVQALGVELELAGEHIMGVLKPHDGEDLEEEKRRFSIESLYSREVASYLIDKALGFGLVPPTVVREFNWENKQKIGSLQLFIPEEEAVDMWSAIQSGRNIVDIRKALRNPKPSPIERACQLTAVFDYIIANPDRHSENILIKNDDSGFYLIDNGFSFVDAFAPLDLKGELLLPGRVYGPRGFVFEGMGGIYIYNEISLPNYITALLRDFLSNSEGRDKLREQLTELGLPIPSVNGVFNRIEKLVEAERFL